MTRARVTRHPTYAPQSHGHDGSACTFDRNSQVPLQPSYTHRSPNSHLPHASRPSGHLAPISAAGTLRKPCREPPGIFRTPGTCMVHFRTLAHLVNLAVARRPTLSTSPIRAHLHREQRQPKSDPLSEQWAVIIILGSRPSQTLSQESIQWQMV